MSDAPPADMSAEQAALFRCLLQPERVQSVDLEPMLVKPIHRAMWASMRRASLKGDVPSAGEFWLRTAVDLHRTHCKTEHKVYELDCQARRVHDAVFDAVNEHPRMRFDQPFDYWIDRLLYVHQCRSMIETAQKIAERAWNYDVDGALVLVDQICSTYRPTPVEAAVLEI